MRTIATLSSMAALAACGPTLSPHHRVQAAAHVSPAREVLTRASVEAPARNAEATPTTIAERAPRDTTRAMLAAPTDRQRAERPVVRERDATRGPNIFVPRATDVFGPVRYPLLRAPRP